jgi:hypothetical protein
VVFILTVSPGVPQFLCPGVHFTRLFLVVYEALDVGITGALVVDAGENNRRESQSRSKSTSSAQDVTPKSC